VLPLLEGPLVEKEVNSPRVGEDRMLSFGES